MNHQILLISEVSEDIRFWKKVATSVQAGFFNETQPEKIRIILAANPECLVFWDVSPQDSRQSIADVLEKSVSNSRLFTITDDPLNRQPDLFKPPIFSHHIFRRYRDPASFIYPRLISAAFANEPFGLDRYFPENFERKKMELKNSHEKESALQEIQKFLENRGVPDRIVTLGVDAADELLMNAIFDAPWTPEKGNYRRISPRAGAFDFEPKERPDIEIAYCADLIGIKVGDNFGSLKRESILKHLDCQSKYPVIGGEIPILIDPSEIKSHLLDTGAQLLKLQAKLNEKVGKLREKVERGDARANVDKLLTPAYMKNIELIRAMRSTLEPLVSIEEIALSVLGSDEPLKLNTYTEPFSYMRRDWSGNEESEAEVSDTLSAIRNVTAQKDADPGLAVVLGAGCGRFAHELSQTHSSVLALELSISSAIGYLMAQRQTASFYEINEYNIASPRDQLRRINPRIPEGSAPAPGLNFCIANALDTPLADGTVSDVYSVFFTPLVPFLPLLSEVTRLLKPGGALVHFGPLNYQHGLESQRFSYDEIIAELRAQGYKITKGPTLEQLHCQTSKTLGGTAYWVSQCFLAVKFGLSEKSILRLRPDIGIISGNQGGLARTITLVIPGEGERRVSGALAEFVQGVNGTRALKDILERLPKKDRDTQRKRASLLDQAEELLYSRVLRILSPG